MPLDNEDMAWMADFQKETLLYLDGIKQRLAQQRNPRLEYLLHEFLATIQPVARKALLGAHALVEETRP